MSGYILQRLIQALLTVVAISIVVFLSLHATGDPAALLAPMDATDAEVEELRVALGLDRPLTVQYLSYLGNLVRGDMGTSFRFHQPCLPLVLIHFGHSLQLTIPAVLLTSIIAIPLGVVAAMRRGTRYDAMILTGALLGQATPIFWLAILLIWIFAVRLGWLPASGRGSLTNFVLPVATIVAFDLAIVTRLTRSSMLEVLREDYMRTARAKGLAEMAVLMRHGLRNAAIGIVSLIGLQIGSLLSGILVVETIFAWPGLGKLMYDAVLQRDIPLVMAGTITVAVMVVLLNLAVDLTYSFLDPRIRLGK